MYRLEKEMNKEFYLNNVAIRLVQEPPLYSDYPLESPEAVVKLMADTLKEYDREVFAVVNLQTDLKPINVNIVSVGALDQALVHPREAVKSMILSNAGAVMLVHNHPSGKLTPSKQDIAMTDRIAKVCETVGIRLVEHIIVGRGKEYFSFCEKGMMPVPEMKYKNNINDLELGGMKVAETMTEVSNAKKVQFVESREKQAEQLKEITDKLEKGVAEIFSSDKYKQFLDTMAKFPRYSVNNSLLIMMQKPDAQLCQSFTGWKEMGRFVKKGEKGIKILAPAPYTIQKEQAKLDESGKPLLDGDGEPVMENIEIKINAFKVVSTFDVSQTDGKELPSLGVDELTGNVDGYKTFLEALKQSCPVSITFEKIEGGAKGFYSQTEKGIAIQEGMSEMQTVKTAIHEMAHQKLHAIENSDKKLSRNSKEVEAESVAYTVCQHYGMDTSDYSFSYVAGWSEGKEMAELKASLNTIRRAASEMISSIDEKMKELVSQKTQEKLAPDVKGKEEKTKKTSVKSKLKEGKDKVAKTPAKKTKEKEAVACV